MFGTIAQPTMDSAPCLPSQCRPFHVEEYRDRLAQVCGSFIVEARGNDRDKVQGSIRSTMISRFETAFVLLDADRVVRDRKMIRSDPGEHLFLIFQYEGECTIIQNDRASKLAKGDFFIADSSVPSEFVYDGRHSAQVSLHLPREEMVARLGPGCAGGQAINQSDSLVPAMKSVLGRLMQAEAGSAALGEALINILCAYFHARAQGSESAATRLYQCAVERLELRARDSSFRIDALAEDLGVSRRTLQRVFSDHEDSFTNCLQAVRLEFAHSRLLNGERNITGVAYGSGFNDLSNFYRLFRERFGVAPGSVKAGSGRESGGNMTVV